MNSSAYTYKYITAIKLDYSLCTLHDNLIEQDQNGHNPAKVSVPEQEKIEEEMAKGYNHLFQTEVKLHLKRIPV